MTSPAPRRRRRDVVLALVVLGAATLAVSAPTWVRATGSTALTQEVDVAVSGSSAAPGVSAAAFVVVAAALALGIVGQVGRWFALAVVALGGVVVVVASADVLVAPGDSARSAVAEVTGTSDTTSAVGLTVAPYLAVALGVAVLLAVAWSLRAGVDWSRRAQRYEAPTAVPAGGPGSAPPVAPPVARPGAPAAAGSAVVGAGAPDTPIDERAAWDALSHGEDPT